MGIRKKRKQPPKRSTPITNPQSHTTAPKRGRPPKVKPTVEETTPAPRSPEKTINCSICLDTSRCRKMKVLTCCHKFHERCINRWLELDIKCPLCRTWFMNHI